MIKLYFATNNKHKLEEAQKVLNKYCVCLELIDVKKIEIQSELLDDIARYAVLEAYRFVKKPVIVEDSGIFIEVLKGFPGPFSNYVYKTIGLNGILKLLEGENNRRARFEAVVALALNEGEVRMFKGVAEGFIAYEIRGSKGFGFDPIFIPVEGDGRTFAEMDTEEKNKFSHRGRAFEALGKWIVANKDKLIYMVT
ncbi:MAG: XTP/dITP diphosphatase [Ignisphaera sp.]|uniref:dITP/XTP pyrophosphatase n=1 Tax=Ignisphaera aggregans TaxID=334771 RepID=A0A7C4JKQ6_9CREN